MQNLLNSPILYLSRFIVNNKGEYYRLLQHVRNTGDWENWLLYMIKGVGETAIQTIQLQREIKILMQDYKHRIRSQLLRIYSQDLINNLFRHPYTKTEFLANELKLSNRTALRYLDELEKIALIEKVKVSKTTYYIDQPLLALFMKSR